MGSMTARGWVLWGAALGALAGLLGAGWLGVFARERPLLEVRTVPRVLHGGLSDPGSIWRQPMTPEAGVLRAVRVAAVDYAQGDPAAGPRLELRTGAGERLAGPNEGRFEHTSGIEGEWRYRFEPPLELDGSELELALLAPASGAAGGASPFLRARGPRIHLAGGVDRTHQGERFARDFAVPESGPGPLAALVLHVRALDLRSGPARARFRDAESGELVAEAESAAGLRQREGHLLLPLPESWAWGRAQRLRVEIELPEPGGVLYGDGSGPALGALLGRPASPPRMGTLQRGEARFEDVDLIVVFEGRRSWGTAARALWGLGGARVVLLFAGCVAVGALLGAGAAGRRPA